MTASLVLTKCSTTSAPHGSRSRLNDIYLLIAATSHSLVSFHTRRQGTQSLRSNLPSQSSNSQEGEDPHGSRPGSKLRSNIKQRKSWRTSAKGVDVNRTAEIVTFCSFVCRHTLATVGFTGQSLDMHSCLRLSAGAGGRCSAAGSLTC